MLKQSTAISAAEAVEPNSGRRSFIRDIGIAALTDGAAVQAEAAPNPDTELIRLGVDLEAAWAAERAAENPYFEAAFEAAYDRSRAIVDRIRAIPAKTLDGFRVKARAVLWCHSGEPIADDAFSYYDSPATNLILAASIVRDLLAVEGRNT